MDILDALMIYESTDDQILGEICRRLARMRRSCCLSQEELSQLVLTINCPSNLADGFSTYSPKAVYQDVGLNGR